MRTLIAPRALRHVLAALIVASLLLLGGCGGEQLAPLTPSTAGGFSTVTLLVNWPSGGNRVVPNSADSIEVTITGVGVNPTILRTLPRGVTSETFIVPAGSARTFTVVAKDSAAQPILSGKKTLDLVAGARIPLTIPLLGLTEPNDTSAQAAAITLTNYVGEAVDTIDTKYSDSVDCFKFLALPHIEYAVKLVNVDSIAHGPVKVTLYDAASTEIGSVTGASNVLPDQIRVALPSTAVNPQTVYVQVQYYPGEAAATETRFFYHLLVSGTAQLDVHID